MTTHKRESTSSAIVLLTVIVVVAAIVGLLIAFSVDDNKSEDAPPAGFSLPLVVMQGVWTAEEGGSKFVATIKDDTISMELGDDNFSMLYWYGSFDGSEQSTGTTITSELLNSDRLVMSQATEKDFLLDGDKKLWFTFEVQSMGVKQRVGLERA